MTHTQTGKGISHISYSLHLTGHLLGGILKSDEITEKLSMKITTSSASSHQKSTRTSSQAGVRSCSAHLLRRLACFAALFTDTTQTRYGSKADQIAPGYLLTRTACGLADI